jgi:hypothetical protein
MLTDDLRGLLALLKEYGVTTFERNDLKITFAPGGEPVDADEAKPVGFSPEVRSDGLTPEEQIALFGREMP